MSHLGHPSGPLFGRRRRHLRQTTALVISSLRVATGLCHPFAAFAGLLCMPRLHPHPQAFRSRHEMLQVTTQSNRFRSYLVPSLRSSRWMMTTMGINTELEHTGDRKYRTSTCRPRTIVMYMYSTVKVEKRRCLGIGHFFFGLYTSSVHHPSESIRFILPQSSINITKSNYTSWAAKVD